MIKKLLLSIVIFSSYVTYGQTNEDNEKLYDLSQQKKYNETINESSRLIKVYPNSEYAYFYYFMRGLAYCNLNNNYKGVTDYEKCVELNPAYKDGLLNLYLIYMETENHEKAIPLIKKLIDIDDDPDHHYDLGLAYFNSSDYQNSIKCFTNFLNMGVKDTKQNRLALFLRGRSKNSFEKGSGCEDIKNCLKESFLESSYYPESLVSLGFSALNYANDSGCIDSYLWQMYAKRVKKASKDLYKKTVKADKKGKQ